MTVQVAHTAIDGVNGKHKRPAALRWLLIGLACIAIGLGIFHTVVYTNFALHLAAFPFDYDQGEGFELNDTVLLSQGQSPYRSNEIYPFYASNYPPIYHVLLIPFVWLFGPAYWYGRLLGFAATLITAGAIGYAVHRTVRLRPVAVLAGLAYLSSNYIFHIGPLFRQHITMVMFETLAIVCLAIALPPRTGPADRVRWRPLVAGLALLLVAGFTKQLAIATAAGFFLYFLIQRPRLAVLCGIGFAIVGGALFVLCNIVTGGQWWLNIITANVNGYLAGQFAGLLRQFLTLHGALFALAAAYLLYELYLARLSAYSVWFVASAGSAVLSGKWGAGDSYFATMIAAMCVLAGLFTGRAIRGEWPTAPSYLTRAFGRLQAPLRRALAPAALLAFCIYGAAVFKMPLDQPGFATIADALNLRSNTAFPNFYDSARWTVGYAKLGQIPTEADVAAGWQIVQAARRDPSRPILSEEAAFSFHAGKPVVTNPTQLLNLYNNNALDPSALVKMINDKAFSAVIFRARFYPQPVLDAVDANYRVAETVRMNDYSYQILLPR